MRKLACFIKGPPKAGLAIEARGLLAIDRSRFVAQKDMQAAIAKPPALDRKFPQSRPEAASSGRRIR